MKPQILALITAMAWGIGGYFEKKGLHLGNLSPQVGITIRTFIAFLILAAVSFSQWKSIAVAYEANPKALIYMILGGGVVAGSLGMLCFYSAIKGAPLGKVMPIAFTSPFFGALMGVLIGGEPVTLKTIIGTLMTIGGIVILTFS